MVIVLEISLEKQTRSYKVFLSAYMIQKSEWLNFNLLKKWTISISIAIFEKGVFDRKLLNYK